MNQRSHSWGRRGKYIALVGVEETERAQSPAIGDPMQSGCLCAYVMNPTIPVEDKASVCPLFASTDHGPGTPIETGA